MSDCMTLTPPTGSQELVEGLDIDIRSEADNAEDAPFAGAVYHEIRQELARRGVPPEQVAFIQDYATKARRAALFQAINRGDIRVLIASKQSTGMNIQKRLLALHHLDCPWRPGDLEQREGRIIRQGNQFPEAMVFAYVTEGSFDGYSWQTIHTKAGFIEQMKRGDVTVREIDDIGDAVLSAAEIKAIASGNPLIMEKVKLEAELQKLEAAEAADRANRVRMRRRLADGELERAQLERRLPFLAAACAQAEATHGEKEFKAAILQGVLGNEATAYTKREAAGEAVLKIIAELDALAMQQRERQTRTVGRYRGFLLCGNAYTMGSTDLSVCFEHEEQIRALSATSTALKTPLGVFASIERQLQGIGEEIVRAERRLTELAQDEAKVQAILATPWPQTTELAEQRARLERINEELDQSERETKAIPPAAPVIPDPEQGERAGDLVVVDECDGYIAPEWDAAAMEQSIVLLPEPSDPEAMAAAIRALSAAAEPEPVEAAEAGDEVLELPPPTLEIPVVVEAEPVEAAPVTIDEVVAIALPQPAIPVAPKPTARPVLVFGQPVARRRRVAVKQAAPKPVDNGMQLELFAAPYSSGTQIGLW